MTTLISSFPNDDWSVEEGDASVGVFGTSFYHESCPIDDPEEAINEVIATSHDTERFTLTDTRQLTCSSCGATAQYLDVQYEPQEEPDGED